MMKSKRDIWCEWLLPRRFGGDTEHMKAALEYLYRVRDRIFGHASLSDGETVLDVGCGDGLISDRGYPQRGLGRWAHHLGASELVPVFALCHPRRAAKLLNCGGRVWYPLAGLGGPDRPLPEPGVAPQEASFSPPRSRWASPS